MLFDSIPHPIRFYNFSSLLPVPFPILNNCTKKYRNTEGFFQKRKE